MYIFVTFCCPACHFGWEIHTYKATLSNIDRQGTSFALNIGLASETSVSLKIQTVLYMDTLHSSFPFSSLYIYKIAQDIAPF